MNDPLIRGIHWLEPIVPAHPGYPDDVLELADSLPFLAGQLDGSVAPETARRLGKLMRLTNSYYSNLIEGQYTEPAELSQRIRRREAKELGLLAITHIQAQEAFERVLDRRGTAIAWSDLFGAPLLKSCHRRLFEGAKEADLRVREDRLMLPGQLRDESQQDVVVGGHCAPSWESVTPMLSRLQQVYGAANNPRAQLLASMAYHHRLAFVHPFEDGNGRVVRMVTHLQLARIGLASPLWSISRGLARKQDEYYARLSAADQGRRGDLDGRGQLTQAGLIEFVRFMLSVCKDQIQYTREAMAMPVLRERLERIVQFEPRFIHAGIKPEGARALYLLIIQGKVSRADFKSYFNLHDKTATNQLRELLTLGVVEAPSPKSRELYPGFPVWFAQLLFPDLHRRFQ
ncbi:Fic family protein [Metapseudomonas furukawaii]|uniref:Fic family protein n=1 Tax=Metapseudomonas furukawaii TaxID=1149133 RepID=UPI00227CC5EF|nr:Fic family protein [Pseudomonas furukawaii]WAG81227.1 Fic family protein [Pseudomonas furukawaii]